MTPYEQKLQSRSIAALVLLNEVIHRCKDDITVCKLRYAQTFFEELYKDWLARVEPKEANNDNRT